MPPNQGCSHCSVQWCRVGAVTFLSANEAVTGAEDGLLRIFDLRSPTAPVLAFQVLVCLQFVGFLAVP